MHPEQKVFNEAQASETKPNLKDASVPDIVLPVEDKKVVKSETIDRETEAIKKIENAPDFSELYVILEELLREAGGTIVSRGSGEEFTFDKLKGRIEAFKNDSYEPDMEDRFSLIPRIYRGAVRRKAVELVGTDFMEKKNLNGRIFKHNPEDYAKVKPHRAFSERKKLNDEFRG